ncbi:RBP45 [Symbiodinium microadriaticum]|nr:RBP45 [Symbiodinium microadriaticum]
MHQDVGEAQFMTCQGQLAPDQISMNSMIAACRTGALWRLALRLLCRCVLVELLPSAVTFNSALGALEPATSWPRLLASLNYMRDHLVSPSIISVNTGLQLLEKSPGPSWIRCLQLLALAGRLWVRRDAVSLTVVLNSIVGSSRSGPWFGALAAIAGARQEGLRASDAGLGVAIQSAVSGSRWSRALDFLEEGLPTELSRLAAVEACEMGSLHLAAASLLGEVTATTGGAFGRSMAAAVQVPDVPVQELPRTLWVGDVELWMDERYISKCFEGTGQLRNIKIVRRPLSCNFAFIEFAQHEDAAALLASTAGQPFRCALGHSFRLNWTSSGAFGERERERYKTVSAARTSMAFRRGRLRGKRAGPMSRRLMDMLPCLQLYVGNLDASVRDSDLKKLFERRPGV